MMYSSQVYGARNAKPILPGWSAARAGFGFLILCLLFFLGFSASAQEQKSLVLRVGHFPNITHAQGLIAHHLSRQGKGWFEERLGPNVTIEWFVYNAGPTAMEAFFAKSLDITYVGPNPALNAHIRSKGQEVRILAGAAKGGAALVVRKDGNIKTPADLKGKKIATPQFGNTQDVSCRAWLSEKGFTIRRTGGDVLVVPTANPDQISMLQSKKIDGAWTVEPWVSRLEMEADGQVLFEEKESLTTILACRSQFLQENRDLARQFALAHAELTKWILENPEEAQKMVVAELSTLTRSDVSLDLVQHAWKRLQFTPDVKREEFEVFIAAAQKAGFLEDAGSIEALVEVPK